MPTALTTIAIAKEQAVTYKPLLLAVFTFADASVLRVATAPLNSAEGGFQPSGITGFPHNSQNFFNRILEQDIGAVQALSETGIDISPTVSIHLADGDKAMWTDHENTKGFKGASVVLYFLFWDANSATFSTDYLTKFAGICNPATLEDTTLTVSATNLLNLAKVLLPVIPDQKRCPWQFPSGETAALAIIARQAAADSKDSQSYECGYSPDATGSNARGNYVSGVTPYTNCDFTKDACIARGMYNTDSSARSTKRFGGNQFDPPNEWAGKVYFSGKKEEGRNAENTSRQFIPLVYGRAWVTPVVLNWLGEANSSRGEAVLCYGDLGGVGTTVMGGCERVILNDTEVPFTYYANATNLFRWEWIASGARTGAFNADLVYDSKGDPHGSLATIEVVVPRRVAESADIPNIRCLVRGPKIRVYWIVNTSGTAVSRVEGGSLLENQTPGSTVNINGTDYTVSTGDHTTITLTGSAGSQSNVIMYADVFTGCGVWHTLDQLIWSNYRYQNIDPADWARAASVAGDFGIPTTAVVTYTDLTGNASVTHERYASSMVISQRRSAAEVVLGMRRGMKAILVPNSSTGLLQLFVDQTMADQQPAAISGSNNAGSITSKNYAGTPTNGYSAYDFSESHILKTGDGTNARSSLKIYQRSIHDAPNRIAFSFQNRDNQYATDTISVVDSEAVSRAGPQEITTTFEIDGVNSYDQAKRIIATELAKSYRGNTRADTGGSLIFEFDTSFRVAHLRVGHICRITYQQLALTTIPIRVLKIQPSTDFRTCRITAVYHNDEWYTDAWGQGPDPKFSRLDRSRLDRPAFVWLPNQEAPVSGNPLYGPTEYQFGIAQQYDVAADNTAIAKIVITGKQPINHFSAVQPPFHDRQGTKATTGGAIAGGTQWFISICSTDAAGLLSTPSDPLCIVVVPTGTNTNTVTVSGIVWPTGAVGYHIFAGPDPFTMSSQGTQAASTPASITLTAMNTARYGMPDVEADHLRIVIKRVFHSGSLGTPISSRTATTIVSTGAGWTVNQFANGIVSVLAKAGSTASIAPLDFRIASNTADTLTISGAPDLTTILAVGDVFVIRSIATTFTATTIGDANYVNSFAPSGLVVNEEVGRLVRIIGGNGRGQHPRQVISNTSTVLTISPAFDVTPDATSVFIVEEANRQYPQDVTPIKNGKVDALTSIVTDTMNYDGQTYLVQVFVIDPEGAESVEYASPLREIYVFGNIGAGGGGGGSEQLAAVDQPNGLYSISVSASTAPALAIFRNGLRQIPGASEDYTLSGITVTFNAFSIPLAGDKLWALF
jgi:hypothetical protein